MEQLHNFDDKNSIPVSNQEQNKNQKGRNQKNQKGRTKKKEENNKINTFSYDIVYPRTYRQEDNTYEWLLIEKGTLKTFNKEKYEYFSDENLISAKQEISKEIIKTPCHKGFTSLEEIGFNIYLKYELSQHLDSLLTRGVIYTLQQLSRPQKTAGVIAISTGNFASILCYYGWKFRIAVTVVILDSADDEVLELCEQYSNSVSSINVIKIKSDSLLEAHKFALAHAIKHGLVYLDSYNHPNMIIGQATVGLEILEQMCDFIDAVILPTTFNGCSLTEGMAVAIKRRAPEIQVIKVKPNAIDRNMEGVKQEALRNELNIPVRGRYFCYDNLEKSFIDKCITIDQAWIDIATEYLLDTESVCDLHASIALAPILSGQLDNLKGKSVIIPLFGRTDSMDFVKADRYAMLINAINRRYFTL